MDATQAATLLQTTADIRELVGLGLAVYFFCFAFIAGLRLFNS